MRYLANLTLIILGGLAYWFFGQGILHKMWRPISVAFISLMMLRGMRMRWWVWVLTGICMWASLTTYYKWGGQEDVELYNWIITGFMYGLSILPMAIATNRWRDFTKRCLILASTLWLFSDDGVISGAFAQEIGRGMLYVGTLMLFKGNPKL